MYCTKSGKSGCLIDTDLLGNTSSVVSHQARQVHYHPHDMITGVGDRLKAAALRQRVRLNDAFITIFMH